MNIDKSGLVKTAAKASLYVVSRIIGFTLLGIVISLIILVLLFPEMGVIGDRIGSGGMPIARAGGIGAVIALVMMVIVYWPITLMITIFGIVFPLFYFIMSKKHGINKAIEFIVKERKGFVVTFFMDRLFEYVKGRSDLMERARNSGTGNFLREYVPEYAKKMKNMPLPVRGVIGYFIRKADINGIVSRVLDSGCVDEVNLAMLREPAEETVNDFIDERIAIAGTGWFFILAGIHIVLCVVLKIII